MPDFDRAGWIDAAGSLWARLVNTPRGTFLDSPDRGRLWSILEQAGVGTAAVRCNEWLSGRWVTERYVSSAELEDLAMYFAALKQLSDDEVGSEFDRWKVTVGLKRLIELASELPYDARLSPWLVKAA